MLHPTEGPDAFPNRLGFAPEKLLAESSYQPPGRLFENGTIQTVMVAGEEVEVGPNRSDTSDSVGFYFPGHRMLISNFMVPGVIFNIYSLGGGPYRDPQNFLEDARWMESKNAEILLDLHGAPLTGVASVREAIQRSADQVQLIHDHALRMIALGMDGREAAEAVYMPLHMREGWEAYGQVESHVRQVYNGTVGWFGHDIYDINPLSVREEAARTIELSGGPDAVRQAASDATEKGGIANWQWALRLTSLLLQVDPQGANARRVRATAARALGQRTISANARGWYMTEALEIEGRLLADGKPVTLDLVRAVLGTPSIDDLMEASPAANLEFLRYLVDPSKAEERRVSFTLAVEGENAPWLVELRNGVIVASSVTAPAELHVNLSRRELAEFILGLRPLAEGNARLAGFEEVLDRSHFMLRSNGLGAGLDEPQAEARCVAYGEQ